MGTCKEPFGKNEIVSVFNRNELEINYIKISINLLPEHLASLNLWAALQSDHPDESEAIRRILNDIELSDLDSLQHKIEENKRMPQNIYRKYSL